MFIRYVCWIHMFSSIFLPKPLGPRTVAQPEVWQPYAQHQCGDAAAIFRSCGCETVPGWWLIGLGDYTILYYLVYIYIYIGLIWFGRLYFLSISISHDTCFITCMYWWLSSSITRIPLHQSVFNGMLKDVEGSTARLATIVGTLDHLGPSNEPWFLKKGLS